MVVQFHSPFLAYLPVWARIQRVPNDRMLRNTSEVPQKVSSLLLIEAYLVNLKLTTIYLFGCLRGTLVVSNVLSDFFGYSETVSYPNVPVESSRKWSSHTFIRRFQLNNSHRNNLLIKWKNKPPKIVSKLVN